jgi:hypothetical protein
MIERDAYTHTFASEALETLLGVLASVRPGRLRTFSVVRDESGDHVECTFELDAQPGVEFSYRHGILSEGREPLLAAESAVGIFFGAIVERTASHRPAVDGRVDLLRG